MKNRTNMAELMKQVEAFEKPQNLDEGFASDAQRRAAFAQGYKAKGKKDKKDEEVLDEAKATLSRFGGDRLKSSIMNLAKQRGLKVKDLGKDKIEISGNGKVVMAITLAVQKKDVKINEEVELDEGKMKQMASLIDDIANAMKKDRNMKPFVSKFVKDAQKTLDPKRSLEKVLPDYVPGKDIARLLNMGEETDIQEDGHTDVASAIRQCKTMVEDAMQITSKLQTMNPEDSLPSWWTNKLAVSSNSMNKLRDYFLVPTTEEVELDEKFEYVLVDKDNKVIGVFGTKQRAKDFEPKAKKQPALKNRLPLRIQPIKPKSKKVGDTVIGIGEEVELEEKAGDIPDLKNLIGELVKASGMHLAQSKRVQAHVDMMTKANAKGPEGAGGIADLKKIVGELQKASEAHKRQSKSIDAHVKFMEKMEMKEYIEDELDENASRAFDDLIKTGGVDKKDFQKAKQLYMKKDLMGLRKFIYNLDTDPLESIMDIISKNDDKAFMKMYPKSKKGEYMSSIAHTHKDD